MIAFLQGVLAAKKPASALIDVQGVGYEVFISLSTYDRLPATGSPCKLLTYHHIREDQQMLFGFADETEKAMFERLIEVSGVGPKTALGILSGLTVTDLLSAIADHDVKRISAVKGIGKKTAERLIVELKDKIDPVELLASKTAGGGDPGSAVLRDTILALTSLGFTPDQARVMAQAARAADPTITEAESLLRLALKQH